MDKYTIQLIPYTFAFVFLLLERLVKDTTNSLHLSLLPFHLYLDQGRPILATSQKEVKGRERKRGFLQRALITARADVFPQGQMLTFDLKSLVQRRGLSLLGSVLLYHYFSSHHSLLCPPRFQSTLTHSHTCSVFIT